MTVQDCNEALNLQTGVTFENYVNQGGLLNKTHFNLLNKMQEDSNPVYTEKDQPYLKQAGIMASKAGIELTESQIYRYVRLRQLMAPKSQEDNTPGLNPWQLGDQPLLAEILMLTDQEKWQQFVKISPRIRSRP